MTNSTTNSQSQSLPENPVTTDGNSSYRPSVPISVYRELSAELQATQAQLDTLYEQNQKLERYNKQLRQEIAHVLASTQHLEKVMRVMDSSEKAQLPAQIEQPIPSTAPGANGAFLPFPTDLQTPDDLVAEVQPPQAVLTPEENAKATNSWLLWILVILLSLTAFGTGFLVVRPLLNNSQQN